MIDGLRELRKEVDMLKQEGVTLRSEIRKKDTLLIKTCNDNLNEVAIEIEKIRDENKHLTDTVEFLTHQLSGRSTITDDENDGVCNEDLDESRFVTTRCPTEKRASNNSTISQSEDEKQFCAFRDAFLLIGTEIIQRIKSIQQREQRVKLDIQIRQIKEEKHRQFQKFKDSQIAASLLESMSNSNIQTKTSNDNICHRQHIGDWIKHSNEFAANTMKKWGYEGGGLGKKGDGIKEPISTDNKKFSINDRQNIVPPPWPENTVLIAGSSMINALDENRMSKKLKCEFVQTTVPQLEI